MQKIHQPISDIMNILKTVLPTTHTQKMKLKKKLAKCLSVETCIGKT